MTRSIPFPHEILAQWRGAISSSDLAQNDVDAIMSIVKYAQPPLSISALKKAAALLEPDPLSDLDLAALTTSIAAKEPKQIGSNYPVYFALITPRLLGLHVCPAAELGRQLISEWFSDVSLQNLTSRNNFYNHVLAVRDVIMAVIHADWPANDEGLTPAQYFQAAISHDLLYSQRQQLAEGRKYEIFTLLAAGSLQPGEKIREAKGPGGSGKKRKKQQDVWHDKRVKQLVGKSTPPSQHVTTRPDERPDVKGSIAADTELSKVGMQHKAAPSKDGGTETVTLQRDTPSALTHGDDSHIVRRWSKGAAASSLAAMTDLSRLHTEQIDAVLAAPLQPLERTFAVLLLSTGLPTKRLMRLTTTEDIDFTQKQQRDEPYWCPMQGMLYYRLLDGPSASTSAPDTQWIQLRLPAELATTLTEYSLLPSGQRPFRQIRARLNRKLKKHFRHRAGIAPTANRLSATSWLYCRPNAIDDVAATALSGQFNLDLAAPAAYRQIARAEIQRVFDDTLQSLKISPAPPFTHPAQHDVKPSNCHAMMGSAVACSPKAFDNLFQELRDGMIAPKRELSQWWIGIPFPKEALITLYQHIAAHELLAWLLSTGARPIGRRSENRMGSQMQWLHDKNSARGIESRVLPLLTEIRNSANSLHCWTQSLLNVMEAHGIPFKDQRTSKRDTPAWLLAPRRGNTLVLRDMTSSDMTSLLSVNEWPSNMTRHAVATWLRHRVPDATVDQLLGHARHGRSLSSPRAGTSTRQQSKLRRELSDWLIQCGYRQLDWERMPWHF